VNIKGLIEDRWSIEKVPSPVSPKRDDLKSMKTDEKRASMRERGRKKHLTNRTYCLY
jgi:hypothetical protein